MREAEFKAASGLRRKYTALTRWRDVIGSKRNATLKADLMYEMRTKHNLITKWKQAHAKQADNEATADKAHAFFVLRATFKIWKGARTLRQQHAFVEQRRLKDLRAVMNCKRDSLGWQLTAAWREATIQSLEDKVKIEEFQREQAKVSFVARRN